MSRDILSEPCRPELTAGAPAAGCFVRQQLLAYRSTQVYHGLYLPADWQPGAKYPVIVEYAGNQCRDICTGRVDDCRLGFYQSGGRGFIWLVLPYISISRTENCIKWWGDLPATVAYCREAVQGICETWGGDSRAVFLTGFSRGAIACGYVGLHDSRVASLWCGFMPHSHHDGGSFTPQGAVERLSRVRGRPTFITYGSDDNGKGNSLIGAAMLGSLGSPVTAVEIPGLGHSDRWIETDSPLRRRIREWMQSVVASAV